MPEFRILKNEEFLPALQADLIAEPLGEELLVWDPRRRLVHHLDRVATLVFRGCREGSPLRAVEAALLAAAGSAAAARALLQATLALLAERHLLADPPAGEEGGAFGPAAWQASRRSFLGGAGKAALALPVLSSIFVPGAAAAVSVVGGVPAVAESLVGASGDRYAYREDQPFRLTSLNPHTTFGADVDTASYANVRRFVAGGQLPPADAVRIEELVNAFRYADPEPPPGAAFPFAVSAELAPCPWEPRHKLLRLGLQSRRVDVSALPPRRLVFLLDTSGSMSSPDKLPLVRRAMWLLAETLRPIDQVAIAAYAGSAGVVLEPTSGDQFARIVDAMDRLEAGGSTAGGAGILLAYRLAEGMRAPGVTPRVLLATDGDFNVGTTNVGELVRLIEEQREKGILLSVLGFGSENLNDATMEMLADRGDGNYSYIDSLEEARRVLVEEGGATLHCLARDLKLQVEWNPSEVAAWRLLGYENRMLATEDFANDKKDGGELGAGHHVTALFELVEPGVELPASLAGVLGHQSRYAELEPRRPEVHAGELGIVRLRFKPPAKEDGEASLAWEQVLNKYAIERSEKQASDDFRLAAGAAAFGMALRRSPDRGGADWTLARQLVAGSLGGDVSGQRAELLALVEAASRLEAPAEEEDDAL
jgi:Ca-activated chloride channel family protein